MRITLLALGLRSGYGDLSEGRDSKHNVFAHDAYIAIDSWEARLKASRGAVSVVAGVFSLDGRVEFE